MSTSRLSGFGRLVPSERRRRLGLAAGLVPAELATLDADALPLETADSMVENVVGTFALPFAVALNFVVNRHDVVVPLVVEEPSVVAAASSAALLARAGGGFAADADAGVMIGQIRSSTPPTPARPWRGCNAPAAGSSTPRVRSRPASVRAVPGRATSRSGC